MGVIRFCCWCDHEDNCEIKDPQKCGDKYSTLEEDAADVPLPYKTETANQSGI